MMDAVTVDTSEIQDRFVEETRKKFADAGYDPSKEDVRILVTRLPAALFESLFGRILQPMLWAEARPAPRTNEIYIDQAKRITTLEDRLADTEGAYFATRETLALRDAALATEKAYSVGVEMAWQGTDVNSYREWLESANDVE